MINHKQRFIFIHIPKTGGESIASKLCLAGTIDTDFVHEKQILRKHETICEALVLDYNTRDYFKFSFVRNPWDRLVSLWAYCHKRGIKPVSNTSFNEFILHLEQSMCYVANSYYWNSHRKVNVLYPQYHFISDWFGQNQMDYIGRFENLQHDFDTVCDRIGIPSQQLPQHNKSNHRHYTEYYNDETRTIVEERYCKDIQYFGYEFGK